MIANKCKQFISIFEETPYRVDASASWSSNPGNRKL